MALLTLVGVVVLEIMLRFSRGPRYILDAILPLAFILPAPSGHRASIENIANRHVRSNPLFGGEFVCHGNTITSTFS